MIEQLPISYKDRLLTTPGVKEVTFSNWFGGVYQEEKNFFPEFAIDEDSWRQMYKEFVVPDDQWAAFLADREGAVVGEKTAKRFGWKIGDRIPMKGTIYPGNWEFNIRGIYHPTDAQGDGTQFWFHWKRLDEASPRKGEAGWYTVRITNRDDTATVVKTIDAEFANSPFETKTDTEKAFMANWIKQMGNIELLILTIGGVVFFTLLLVTGNTMAIAVRERTSELAVLKAIGFSDRFVTGFVLAESILIAAVGGALGLGAAKLMTMGGDITGGFFADLFSAGKIRGDGRNAGINCGRTRGNHPGGIGDEAARCGCVAEGVRDGHSPELQHTERAGAVDVVGSGRAWRRGHRRRVYRDAIAGEGVQSHACVVRLTE
jgi:putative ABC transport system permease protein